MEDTEDIFFQCGQDPLADFSQRYPEIVLAEKQRASELAPPPRDKKQRQTRDRSGGVKKKQLRSSTSFVINNDTRKGIKLIQIKVLDLIKEPTMSSKTESEDDNMVFNAQYVVRELHDEIMDLTESVVRKISKKLCNDNFIDY